MSNIIGSICFSHQTKTFICFALVIMILHATFQLKLDHVDCARGKGLFAQYKPTNVETQIGRNESLYYKVNKHYYHTRKMIQLRRMFLHHQSNQTLQLQGWLEVRQPQFEVLQPQFAHTFYLPYHLCSPTTFNTWSPTTPLVAVTGITPK